jgi:hypothetical protein
MEMDLGVNYSWKKTIASICSFVIAQLLQPINELLCRYGASLGGPEINAYQPYSKAI